VNTTNNYFPLWLVQHVSTHMSQHRANLEPLNISEVLLTVHFVSKAADPWVSRLMWVETCCKNHIGKQLFVVWLRSLKINKTKHISWTQRDGPLKINIWYFIFCWPCILVFFVTKTNQMHYLFIIYFVNQPLYVSYVLCV
jgi:hypothetical protein